MQDNNSNSLTNGDTPTSDRFANIRAAEERKLLTRKNGNGGKKIIMEQMTNIPIPEDDNEDADKNSGTASTPVDNTDSVLLKNNQKTPNHPQRMLDAIYTRYEISKKSRLPFIILSALSLILLLTVILLAIFWPYIPSYMRRDVCIEQECIDATKQILGFADIKESVCENPYKFSCGNFINLYKNHDLYLINKGEFSSSSHFEYEDLNAINLFISKLPNLPSRSSIQPMIKKIYANCMNIRSEERSTENLQVLKTILETARGWNILESSSSRMDSWSLLENLPKVQVNFGVSPFFRVSIEDGNITLSEGELGLPDEQLYFLHRDHPIIIAYKELIRDVHNSLKASTNLEAESFVEDLFGFEKRIVNAMRSARLKGSISKIYRLYDVKTRAHSLPIDTTIQNMFPNYRIDDDTPIKVRDLELIHQISVITTGAEPKILNDFVMWTLVRRFLPLMSHKIRSSLESFQRKMYGNQFNNMPWHFCTKLTHDWMKFGIEALRQNPQLIVVDSSKLKRDEYDEQNSYEDHLNKDQINLSDEFIKLIFYHLRDAFRTAISSASWIDTKFSDFVNYRLSNIRLQLGIPQKILRDHAYVQQYYHEFIINEMNFMKNLEQDFNIEKKLLGNLLKGNLTEEDRIVFEMFSTTRNLDNRKIKYLKDLNMVIVDREILREPYYHYKYPLAVNFARIGTDLASILLESAFEIGEAYKEILFMENQFIAQENDILYRNTLEGESLKCINELYSIDNRTFTTPGSVRKSLFSTITSANVVFKALGTLTTIIENDPAKYDALLIRDLNLDKRQIGLNKYNTDELFAISYLQKHCSVISDEYKNIKVLAEGKLPERLLFDIVWNNVPVISDSFECSTDTALCKNIL